MLLTQEQYHMVMWIRYTVLTCKLRQFLYVNGMRRHRKQSGKYLTTSAGVDTNVVDKLVNMRMKYYEVNGIDLANVNQAVAPKWRKNALRYVTLALLCGTAALSPSTYRTISDVKRIWTVPDNDAVRLQGSAAKSAGIMTMNLERLSPPMSLIEPAGPDFADAVISETDSLMEILEVQTAKFTEARYKFDEKFPVEQGFKELEEYNKVFAKERATARSLDERESGSIASIITSPFSTSSEILRSELKELTMKRKEMMSSEELADFDIDTLKKAEATYMSARGQIQSISDMRDKTSLEMKIHREIAERVIIEATKRLFSSDDEKIRKYIAVHVDKLSSKMFDACVEVGTRCSNLRTFQHLWKTILEDAKVLHTDYTTHVLGKRISSMIEKRMYMYALEYTNIYGFDMESEYRKVEEAEIELYNEQVAAFARNKEHDVGINIYMILPLAATGLSGLAFIMYKTPVTFEEVFDKYFGDSYATQFASKFTKDTLGIANLALLEFVEMFTDLANSSKIETARFYSETNRTQLNIIKDFTIRLLQVIVYAATVDAFSLRRSEMRILMIQIAAVGGLRSRFSMFREVKCVAFIRDLIFAGYMPYSDKNGLRNCIIGHFFEEYKGMYTPRQPYKNMLKETREPEKTKIPVFDVFLMKSSRKVTELLPVYFMEEYRSPKHIAQDIVVDVFENIEMTDGTSRENTNYSGPMYVELHLLNILHLIHTSDKKV